MERILNEDEKIRKAEEIYFRRNNKNIVIKDKPNYKAKRNLKDKILLQLLAMFNIAVIVFCVQNKDFIFTEQFLGVLNEYNVGITSKVNEFLGIEKSENNSEITSGQKQENSEAIVQNLEPITEETQKSEISSSVSEMNLDIENLKAAYSFVKPIEGIITSAFGSRTSENQNITGYHTGIDVAAEKGTYIKASMGGIVTLVSDEGDYGKHMKIRCNNVSTLYAHCSNIFVKEGQIVAQGQDIGEVGSTGNSTGPHLHFEIRVDDRFVDPLKILQF